MPQSFEAHLAPLFLNGNVRSSVAVLCDSVMSWACSSVGRAVVSKTTGRGFESRHVLRHSEAQGIYYPGPRVCSPETGERSSPRLNDSIHAFRVQGKGSTLGG